ncbi:MAG TPA: PaaI family thioesterase [Kofleriaceae bacterium]|nr:PaaI family thioesterase [Kofleriaceae bacterium]
MAEQDVAAMINANLGGWNTRMGLQFTKVTPDECIGELVVGEQHLQPYGIVHGGVHTGIIEAACSTGAAIVALARGQTVVGLENATSFITAARSGTLRVTATPVTRGRRTQVWEAVVTNEQGKTCATGRVRLLCLDAGSELAGEPAGLKP